MHRTPKLQEMVQTLTATPSISSTLTQYDQSNLDVVHLLANWLDSMGFAIKIKPVSGYPGKANLIATMGEGTDGLLLSGHTDTVPIDSHLWHSDPFTLQEKGDRWYGLGVCDMKSFLAICLSAVAPYIGQSLQKPLTILGTADEESSMCGARALDASDLNHARYAIIGEPTSLVPVTRHKGIMMLSLKVMGKSGHSSKPELGKSALDAAGSVIHELGRYRRILSEKYQDTNFEVVEPTLNLGCIHGGDNPNRICDHVELAFDLRILPGMNNHAIISEISDRLEPLVTDLGLQFELQTMHPPLDAFESSGTDLLATIQKTNTRQPASVAFATEAPFLTNLGIETIVIGPGSIDHAHRPDEFLELAQLDPTIAIIRALIDKYCI
ncbi:MAG: acetylornithine deacetylase [Pseudomonadales bacterium]|nr:acetylornithine deacetylase [Gammaproteobacteria bacterium]MDP6025552.1 acetylornithine deacetylase [Pseudomonadales bacterium]MDP6315174.1 acetylornithine deacetylase [Pseudomonadales bacterium]MDP7314407.1 acetylornithine deacetylase [Pseudomonadales bacterium]MDP7575607.1 acetylornithine deacetylase [Pseudomonadales bacterium]